MREDMEILGEHLESLGLKDKSVFTIDDRFQLWESLYDSDELTLASYVKELTVEQLADLVSNLQ